MPVNTIARIATAPSNLPARIIALLNFHVGEAEVFLAAEILTFIQLAHQGREPPGWALHFLFDGPNLEQAGSARQSEADTEPSAKLRLTIAIIEPEWGIEVLLTSESGPEEDWVEKMVEAMRKRVRVLRSQGYTI